MGEFIEHLARRFRKYNASLIIGTQMVSDFQCEQTGAINLGAKAAWDNSHWHCYLEQGSSAFKKERLDTVEQVCRTLRTAKGNYSEILIEDGNGFFEVARHRLDPYSLALYESEGPNYRKMAQLLEEGVSIEEALDRVVKGNES